MLTAEERKNFEINPIIEFCYDFILPISEDRVLATHGDNISLITASGDMLCTYDAIFVPMYDSPTNIHYSEIEKVDVCDGTPVDGILIYISDEKFGLLDYDGNELTGPEYRVIQFYGQNSFYAF